MSWNSFGHVLRFSTWGESHGPAIGAVVDGCPPQLPLDEGWIQDFLDKRRPGESPVTSRRREPDRVAILSGVFEGRTTGTPISMMIENVDQRPQDYADSAGAYRPGHADFSYDSKYGHRDWRGGGRSSARETAARVAAGAVARRIIPRVSIQAYLVELGGDRIDPGKFDPDLIARNDFFCPDADAASRWRGMIDEARRAGSSLGAVAECIATDAPAGWGAPVYAKLDADLAGAMMSINAVKAVEIGAGFGAARLRGEQNADRISPTEQGASFESNNAGGILGGISTGQPIVVRVGFKPTSSIAMPQPSITRSGEAGEVSTGGRHDPCVGIRGVPVVEAMMALVLADHALLQRAQCGSTI